MDTDASPDAPASPEPELSAFESPASESPVSEPTVRRLTLKKVLYHPLVGLAIAAHLLLLIVPFSKPQASEPDPEVPEEDVDDSIPVDILNLSALSKPPTPAEPPPAAEPPPPAPVAAPPVPAAIEAPLPEAEPEAAPVEDPPVEPTLDEQPPAEEQPPAYVAQQDQQAFIDNVDVLSQGTRSVGNYRALGLPPLDSFSPGTEANFLNYTTDPPTTLPGAIDAVWMDKQASVVADQITETYGANGVTLTPLANYGGELLYEMKTPDGDTMMFVSLVNFPAGSSLMVTWSTNPLGG